MDSCTYLTWGKVSAITNLDGANRQQTIQGYSGLLAQLEAGTRDNQAVLLPDSPVTSPVK